MAQRIADLKKEIAELRAQLEVEKTNYEHICQNSGDGILVTNYEGQILYANPSACELFEKPKEVLIGSDFGQPIIEEQKTELTIVSSSYKVAEMKVAQSTWESDKAFIITLRDITQLKLEQQSLIEERNFANHLFHSAPTMVVVLDQNGFPIQMNRYAKLITGFKPEDFTEKNWFYTVVSDSDQNNAIEHFNALLNHKNSHECILPLRTKDNHEVLVHWSCSRIFKNDQHLFGILIIGYDITQSMKEHDQLRSSEEKLRNIFDHCPLGIFHVDYNGRFMYLNAKFADQLGFDSTDDVFEYMNNNALSVFEYPESPKKILEFTLQNNSTATFRQRLLKKNGDSWLSKLTIRPIKTPEGQLSHFEGFVEDISRRTKIENDLIRSNKRYQRMASNINAMIYQVKLYPNKSYRFLYVSPKIKEIYEISVETLYQNPTIIKSLHSEAACIEFTEKIFKGINTNKPIEWEGWLKTKSGKKKWLYVSNTFEKKSDNITIIDGLVIDMSDRKLAEENLNKNQLILAKSQSVAQLGSWEWNVKTNEVLWSDQMYTLYDVSKSIKPSKELFITLIHPDDVPKVMAHHKEMFKNSSKDNSIIYRIVKKNGQTRYIKSIYDVKKNANNDVLSIFGTDQDVTHVIIAQNALEESTTKYKRLAENVPGMVYQYQYYHSFEAFDYISPNCQNILEIDAETLTENPQKFRSLFHKDDIPSLQESLDKSIRKLSRWNWEGRIVTPSGKVKWVHCLSKPILLETGVIIWEGIVLDVTDRKTQEEKITLLSTAVEQSANCVVITDANGNIQYTNPKFKVITGYGSEEVLGQNPRLLKSGYHPKSFYDELWETISNGNVWKGELKNKNKKGHHYWETATITPIKDSEGKIINYIAIKENITKQKQAELELKENEKLLNTIYSTLHTGISLITPDGQILQTNRAFCTILGYDEFELDQKNVLDLVPKKYHLSLNRLLKKAIIGKVTPSIEINMSKKNRRRITLQIRSSLIVQANGNRTILASINDITDQKKAEQALKQSVNNYKRIVETASEGLWTEDENGLIIFANHRMCELFDLSLDDILGKSIDEFLDPTENLDLQEVHKGTKKGKKLSRDVKFLKHNNTILWGIINLSPIYNEKNKYIGTLGMLTDITERKYAETELRHSEESLSAIFESLDAGVVIINYSGIITKANTTIKTIYQYSQDELIGKHFEILLPEPARQEHLEFLNEFVKSPNTHYKVSDQDEVLGLRKDGSLFPVDISISKIYVGGEKNLALMVSDITERKQIQSQLLRSQRMESIGLLASGIAHDMNNIITPIMMSTELMTDYVSNSKGLKRLEVIKHSSDRAKQLIQQLLLFAKGGYDKKIPVNLRRVIFEIISFISETFSKSIEIVHNIDSPLPYVLADPTQLHQIILNLCVNAQDAMPQGGKLTIIATKTEIDREMASKNIDAKPGTYALVQIQDTGIGISKKHLNSIFEPFFTTKEHGKGTGLGLSMVYNITQNHSGFIDVNSRENEGTTFNLFLPVILSETQAEEVVNPNKLIKGNGRVILVVDDEIDIREVTSQILAGYDYIPICAKDGEQAIQLYREHQNIIDGVIIDLMMPVMDGFTAISELKKYNANLKILAVSGLIDHKTFSEKSNANIHGLINKPYSTETLLTKLGEMFSEN